MRAIFTTLGEITGAVAVTIGAALAWPPAGFIVGGVLLVAGSVLVSDVADDGGGE